MNSILDYGGAGDGVTDNSLALLTAWKANPQYPYVYFPPGNYAFAGNVTYPNGLACAVTLMGAGADTTVLTWPNGGGLAFNCTSISSCVNVSNLSIASGRANGGNGITLSQTVPQEGSARRPQNNFTNLIFRGVTDSDYWGSAMFVENLSVINFSNVLVTGNVSMAYANVGNGVQLIGSKMGVIYNFTNCTFDCVGNGIVLAMNLQGINIAGCNFTGCTNGIIGSQPPSGLPLAGNIDQLIVANSQFDCRSCAISTIQTVQIAHLFINGNLFLLLENATGILLDYDLSTTIIGNIFQWNGPNPNAQQTGVNISNTGGPGGLMLGNRFWGMQTGWILGETTRNWKIQSNIYEACTNAFSNANGSNSIGAATS
jgi:hypothetical protein